MQRVLLAASLLGVALVVPSGAGSQPTDPVKGKSCDGKEAAFHLKRAKAIIQFAHDEGRYPDRSPMTGEEKAAMRKHKFCLLPHRLRAQVADYRGRIKAIYLDGLNSEQSWCASNPHPDGAGCWVIPASIVECESGGSWSAYNPSGALGPYQLLGHGAPFPVSTYKQAMAHHRIAEDIWAGGAGRSAWVC